MYFDETKIIFRHGDVHARDISRTDEIHRLADTRDSLKADFSVIVSGEHLSESEKLECDKSGIFYLETSKIHKTNFLEWALPRIRPEVYSRKINIYQPRTYLSLPIRPDVVISHGLDSTDFRNIVRYLGRAPNLTELGIFSAMWSEHCSYKSSIKLLKTLPRDGGKLLVAAGEENAGPFVSTLFYGA